MAFMLSRTHQCLRLSLSTGAYRGLYTTSSAFAPSMKVVPFKAAVEESYEDKNARLGRPLSPHLLIYKPQMTSMLSISHRMTGLLLSAYISGLGISALILPEHISTYADALHAGGLSFFALKLVLAYPLGYHFANGIRHLIWDTGKSLSIKGVYNSGYAMLVASAVITIMLASL